MQSIFAHMVVGSVQRNLCSCSPLKSFHTWVVLNCSCVYRKENDTRDMDATSWIIVAIKRYFVDCNKTFMDIVVQLTMTTRYLGRFRNYFFD